MTQLAALRPDPLETIEYHLLAPDLLPGFSLFVVFLAF